ncbi:chemotaxis response regulator protein-glutamate methylesterase [Bacillus sp. EAC]|uniref:protein-glutamate methylesterase/protein-glutamine glutaminase n=1 Tax=Bacillus sp. EAC TaxID=1978338 RepID=UPI000B43D86D|nr:chemotaxis response regulator protein-glutamate methylesterase [Bacillus sp. EAC]
MKKINVLVVDDSAFMRKMISNILNSDDDINVIGTAKTGKEAIEKVIKLKPNVVTLDIEMPVLNGLEALKVIMKEFPVPVIMLSSLTQEGAISSFKALDYGAVDFVPKPSGSISLDIDLISEQLIKKVKIAITVNLKKLKAPVKTIKTPILNENKPEPITIKDSATKSSNQIVCIGTSTGGPRALQEVLTNIPRGFIPPIFIVQHMPAGFTNSLAMRLDKLSTIHIKEAENDEKVVTSTAYIAPGGYHMKVIQKNNELFIELTEEPACNGHRPSVDVLFESISNLVNYEITSAILTGMGADGAKGMKLIKQHCKGTTIAESEETSVVFGMPKAAVLLNIVDEIVPIQQVADTIIKHSK